MKPNTYNGFILEYDGPVFPATNSNKITYDCFCFMGGLSNRRLYKVSRSNGSYTYNTYHRIDKM